MLQFLQYKMAARFLSTLVRSGRQQMQARSYYTVNKKHGDREVVGYGYNGEPNYSDMCDFPMPAIRYKEVTPDIQVTI